MITKPLSQLKSWSLLLSGAMLVGGCASAPNDGANPPSSSSGTSSPSAAQSANATDSTTNTSGRSSTAPPVKPPKGFGNAQGRVMWNGKPAAGIDVSLCEKISFLTGCSGKTFAAKTDKDGNYTIDKVPPGEYGLAVRVFDSNSFIYPTTGAITASKFKIEKDKTLDIQLTNLFKTDLKIVSPKAGEAVKTGQPQLTWKPYEGAEEYEVTLTSEGGDIQIMKTSETSTTPESPLLNGAYQWKVVARNGNGVRIAETNDRSPFKVTGQAGSSKVELTYPKTGTSVPGSGLKFTWKAHPLADGYQIYLNPLKGSGAILSFVNVDGTNYALDQKLAPGTYYWSISAMRDGKKIASSELQNFTVK